jgi:hypothetical protein
MRGKITEGKGFIALRLMPAGGKGGGPRQGGPPGRISVLSRRPGCVPAEPYPPLKLVDIPCHSSPRSSKKLT